MSKVFTIAICGGGNGAHVAAGYLGNKQGEAGLLLVVVATHFCSSVCVSLFIFLRISLSLSVCLHVDQINIESTYSLVDLESGPRISR